MTKRLRIALVALLYVPSPALASVDDDVSALVAASHGLSSESGSAVMTLLSKAQADCGPYVASLTKHLEPSWIAGDASGERARRAENAVNVLVGCGDAGRAALATRYAQLSANRIKASDDLSKRAAQLKRPQHPELIAKAKALAVVDGVRGAIVDALAGVKDARLRDPLLTAFEGENYAMQLRVLDYFERATPRDAAVRAKLAPLLEKRDSRFFQSRKLRSVIE